MRAAVLAAAILALAAAASAAVDPPLVAWGDRVADTVRCRPGEVANIDPGDRAASSCRTVLVRIASDRTARAAAQHATIAEPHAHVFGRTIVTVFQAGRFRDGGAAAVGWATSQDGGRSWRDGLLPGRDTFTRASDPVVSFDPVRGVWIAATLGVTRGGAEGASSGLVVTRSRDGITWEQPIVVDRIGGSQGFDKEWIACDQWSGSPFRGTCYLAYTDLATGGIALRTSTDGGVTWSAPVRTATGRPYEVGAFPVVRPDGTLVLLWAEEQDAIVAARSRDGGLTLDQPAAVAAFSVRRPAGIRSVAIPYADVGPDGRVWVAWEGCLADAPCTRQGVLVTSSADALAWSQPAAIAFPGASAYAPALAVDRGSGRVGVTVYAAWPCPSACTIDGYLVEAGSGEQFGAPRRLNAEPVRFDWTAQARLGESFGSMLGDYFGLVYVGGRPVPVLTLARTRAGKGFRQALFAGLRVAAAG
jgi:hypothetical protein